MAAARIKVVAFKRACLVVLDDTENFRLARFAGKLNVSPMNKLGWLHLYGRFTWKYSTPQYKTTQN